MKISELIKELNEVLKEDGDIDVFVYYNNQYSPIDNCLVVLPEFVDENGRKIPLRLGICL